MGSALRSAGIKFDNRKRPAHLNVIVSIRALLINCICQRVSLLQLWHLVDENLGLCLHGCQSDAEIVDVFGEGNLVLGDKRQAAAGEVTGCVVNMTECSARKGLPSGRVG